MYLDEQKGTLEEDFLAFLKEESQGQMMMALEVKKQAQLRKAAQKKAAGMPAALRHHELVKQLFASYDADGSGRIDVKEFGEIMRDMAIPIKPQRLQESFDAIDADKTGTLDYNELRLIFRDEYSMARRRDARASVRPC